MPPGFNQEPVFRLREGGVQCDERGLSVAHVALLQVTGSRWREPELSFIEGALTQAYGCEVGASAKLGGLAAVARALNAREIARAQIAALLLQLPDPSERSEPSTGSGLEKTLLECGWPLKSWEADLHPRAGVAPNPGWFAPTGSTENAQLKPHGVRVAQAEGGAFLPPERETAEDVRKRIVALTKSLVGSSRWADGAKYSLVFGAGTNKCFLFVHDVAAMAGADPGEPNVLHLISRPPLAAQWADPDYVVPGWQVLGPDDAPQPGDVVAQRLGYRDASGHTMFVGEGGTFIGTGDEPGKEAGSVVQILFRDFLGDPVYRDDPSFSRGPLVYRRWVGQ